MPLGTGEQVFLQLGIRCYGSGSGGGEGPCYLLLTQSCTYALLTVISYQPGPRVLGPFECFVKIGEDKQEQEACPVSPGL